MHGQANLPEVILALHADRSQTDALHGRDKQADEDGQDRNHHQELYQSESCPPIIATHHKLLPAYNLVKTP
jgi:hypothetical protein